MNKSTNLFVETKTLLVLRLTQSPEILDACLKSNNKIHL
ncbi:hypothetical protein SynPROS91_01202 [Synechococcus sp. PROS-9-1]|nr:hypothetical protein SynPROS91_01202 [Synechococcus sp. PROS-9-1]